METQYYMYNAVYNQLATNNLTDNNGNCIANPNEIFVQVLYENTLVPVYLISDQGRIYNVKKGFFLTVSYDKDGYCMASINLSDNGRNFKKIRIHRLELMSFYPLESYKGMACDHRDGCKTNNFLTNLEWVSNIENTRRAWELGLNKNFGENHPLSVYTDEEIHRICSLIDRGYTTSQICDMFGKFDKIERSRLSATISGIRNGKVHLPISTQYNFMNGSGKINYSLEFAYLICCFLSDDRDYTYKELADMLHINNSDRVYFVKYVNDIINGDTALEISRGFSKLKRPLKEKSDNDYLY